MANLGGDGGVDGVAAFAEDFNAGVGGVVVDGDDHGVLGGDGCYGCRCYLRVEVRRSE